MDSDLLLLLIEILVLVRLLIQTCLIEVLRGLGRLIVPRVLLLVIEISWIIILLLEGSGGMSID